MTITDVVALCLVCVKGLLFLVGLVFLASGLDDLFVDVYHAIRASYRRLFVLPRHPPLTLEQLRSRPEQAIAIMIPAWDESAVIRRMLEATLQAIEYSSHHVFVGTYPNDLATQREVELVRDKHANVHRVVCAKDGPTNKADCLNWIYHGIRAFEKEHGTRFEIFVMNDSEDIVHPLYLRLFNYLIPRKDMVQLPVLPLETEWRGITSGHYLDEFAENHSKDMVVRESLTGVVPAAGVGCAFSRRAFETVVAHNDNALFSIDSLTEDYDFGFRLHVHGLKQVFVRHAIDRTVTGRRFWESQPRTRTVKEYIAIREYFPATFRAAYRQKARWIVGIALQGWAKLGWRGDARTKYILFRDRKGLVTNLVNMLGYLVAATALAFGLAQWLVPDAYRYPPIVERGSWLWYLLVVNTVFLSLRLFQRAFFVQRLYGWGQAFLSMPRQVWGNVVNFAAASRALYLFARFLATGRLIAWDKTAHVYPSDEQLSVLRRKLGDLLLERRAITVQQLEAALRTQAETKDPLGAVLLSTGAVREEELIRALASQHRIEAREIDVDAVPPDALRLLPRELAAHHGVFPLEVGTGGRVLLAANGPLTPGQRDSLAAAVGKPIEICLATRADLARALERGYARVATGANALHACGGLAEGPLVA